MIRVAFGLIGGEGWTGGYNYLLNLVGLLSEHGADRAQAVLFFGCDIGDQAVEPFVRLQGVKVVRTTLMNRMRKPMSLARSLVLGVDAPVRALLRAHKIDVVFESAQFFGSNLTIPAIAWIPDFQHRHLRSLFTFGAYWKRELGFRAQLAGGRRVMLSSEAAERDCHQFFPTSGGRTRVIRFAVPVRATLPLGEARAVVRQYGLPPQFFYMPNQFWQHKNHALVIDALAIARERGCKVFVVASGKEEDPRNKEYVPELLSRVSALGLDEQFRRLGLIPYPHVKALMLASRALLNPSRFEGWSTSVEEARALGVPMILSNIAVHVEQVAGAATFFDCETPATLADALCGHVGPTDEERERLSDQAAAESELRARRFALEFMDFAESCCEVDARA
jgi:glycosyltransferase involved in cell wall biosynthesis